MNDELQNAIRAYGQAQFNLGVATLRLEQVLAPQPAEQAQEKNQEQVQPKTREAKR